MLRRFGILLAVAGVAGAEAEEGTSGRVQADAVLKQFGGTSGIVQHVNLTQGNTPEKTAAAFTVITTGDNSDYLAGDGLCGKFQISPPIFVPCSFRAAIEEANANPGLDIINFGIGSGPQMIAPASPLPTITDPVIIDGTTQPGFSGTPIIELNGANAGISANGLHITAGNSTVKGLVINRFNGGSLSSSGILIENNGGNRIEGNFIGTDVNGTTALSNRNGVIIDGSDGNMVGGTAAGARNVISGNRFYGIFLDSSSSNDIAGNFIGTDVSGTVALGNDLGVRLLNSSSNRIGGLAAGARNIISGNTNTGVYLSLGGDNDILGNFIGTDVSGTADLGNTANGVRIDNSTINDIFYNVISGNDVFGIFIASPGSTRNEMLGNLIGTDASGTMALGNGNGILIASSSNNVIGGYSGEYTNTIAFNNYEGVRISGSISFPATGNFFVQSSIHSNGGLGIDLRPESFDGVTANDSADADSGGNNLQNYPVLSEAFGWGGSTTVIGTLNSYANAPFRIEFFSNDSCDTSGYGEGQTYIGTDTVITDGSGNAAIHVTFPLPLPAGKFITATASDSAGNSSEFCKCLAACSAEKGDLNVSGGLSPADVVLMLNCVFLGTGSCDLCFADVNCSGGLSPADVVIELNMVFLGAGAGC
ncbi:MAG TPA: NosD domain-containing protein [Verrucomicrobiae bacterium]|nr:NosD domain-containing protein [Verrucomicrobiae bacterium]